MEFRDAYRDLQVNPLPASIEVRLKDGYPRRRDRRARWPQRLRGFSFVDDVRFGRDWVQKLDHLRNVTGIVGLVIGLAFAAVAVVIIGVTIRLTLLQRAREISIMRLVGRHQLVHPRPVPARGRAQGAARRAPVAGALLRRLPALPATGPAALRRPDLLPDRSRCCGIVVFGVLLGLGGSLVSVGRHLRHV